MSDPAARPLVAVGIVVINREGKVLIGERLASHGAGTYQIPGGHMEFGKTFEEVARDEVREETGLTDIEFKGVIGLSNERIYGKHYVNVLFQVECKSGEPGNPEPEKSRNWRWYSPDNLPSPIFPPSAAALTAWRTGVFLQEIEA